MSRLAVQNSTYAYGGPSRIPRPFGHVEPTREYTIREMQNDNAEKKPSRLQQMQVDYQKQLIKAKEAKLIEIFEQNQQRALQKVNRNNKGMVRDFFNERRNNGGGSAGSPKNNLSPTIEHMYKQKKVEHKQTTPIQRQTFGYNGNHYTSQGLAHSSNQQNGYKSSAGRDRSNPLAPIQKPGQSDNPFPSKPQIVRPRTYKGLATNKENVTNSEFMPKSAPTGNYGIDATDSGSDDSPLPTAKQLEALQQKRKLLQSQRSNKSMSSVQSNVNKPTDFQKWQMDQDKDRENRLQRNRKKNGVIRQPIEDEGYEEDEEDAVSKDDMKRKQAELIAQIEAQQRELEQLKKDRVREEIEEKKELERRKRVEEERKRKQVEDEKRKRRQEEEERLRREHEEEKARKLQEEKKRLRKSSERSRFEYEESDEEMEANDYYGQREPTPPSRPKPTNSVARRHPVPAKTKVTPRAQVPVAGGEHTALYEQADRLEGAIGDTGRLLPCYNCGRKFAEDRLKKHELACKNATKKRKVMDPSKTRTRGTELEQYVNHRQPDPKPKKSNWRAKHESFINAIKYARKVKQIEEQGGSLADLPPPPPSDNSDYVQCPHCSRKFNAQAAERHMPHCKNARARPAPLKRK